MDSIIWYFDPGRDDVDALEGEVEYVARGRDAEGRDRISIERVTINGRVFSWAEAPISDDERKAIRDEILDMIADFRQQDLEREHRDDPVINEAEAQRNDEATILAQQWRGA